MELNREQIVKALENAIRLGKFHSYMTPKLSYEELRDALALIRELTKERDLLDRTLAGVMHSVDKWLDCEELVKDEVTRAATMREKTLQIVEKLTSHNAQILSFGEEYEALASKFEAELHTIKADTVRKMQEKLKACTELVGECSVDNPLAETYSVVSEDTIDQIAKEMLEEEP